MGDYLKKYAQSCDVPVIVFAQLKEAGAERNDFSSRVQNDRTFANHCHTLLEVIPNFKDSTTKIICHKQRWGNISQWELVVQFVKGILKPLDVFNLSIKVSDLI